MKKLAFIFILLSYAFCLKAQTPMPTPWYGVRTFISDDKQDTLKLSYTGHEATWTFNKKVTRFKGGIKPDSIFLSGTWYKSLASGTWGSITGSLANQGDLINKFNSKQDTGLVKFPYTKNLDSSVYWNMGEYEMFGITDYGEHKSTYIGGENPLFRSLMTSEYSGNFFGFTDKTSGDYLSSVLHNEHGFQYLHQDTSIFNDNSFVTAKWVKDRLGSGGNILSGSLTDSAPTTAQINSITGLTPSTATAGYKRQILDSDGSGLIYDVISDGTNWQYTIRAKAL